MLCLILLFCFRIVSKGHEDKHLLNKSIYLLKNEINTENNISQITNETLGLTKTQENITNILENPQNITKNDQIVEQNNSSDSNILTQNKENNDKLVEQNKNITNEFQTKTNISEKTEMNELEPEKNQINQQSEKDDFHNNETSLFEFSLNIPKEDENAEANETENSFLNFSHGAEVILVCNGPNTRKGSNGLCECVEGFEFGDPFSRYGCYHCSHKCHDNAICSYPGKCVCKNGMIGDGIKSCTIPLPVITNMFPTLAKRVGGETIVLQYYTESNYTQQFGYCKFGSTIVKGNITKDGELKCIIPPSNSKGQKVTMSFDSDNWSTNGFVLMYKRKFPIFAIIALLLIFVVSIIGIIYHFKHKKPVLNSEIDQKAESTPFHSQKFVFDNDFDTEL